MEESETDVGIEVKKKIRKDRKEVRGYREHDTPPSDPLESKRKKAEEQV